MHTCRHSSRVACVACECVYIIGSSLVSPLFLLIDAMASYACKSWYGEASRDDIFVISIGGNGQAWTHDGKVAHLTINVAVSIAHVSAIIILRAHKLCVAGGREAYDSLRAHS